MKLATQESPPDLLAAVGRALYGDRWGKALARALINPATGKPYDDDTITRWMSGRTVLPVDHGVFISALALVEARRVVLGRLAAELRRLRSVQALSSDRAAAASSAQIVP